MSGRAGSILITTLWVMAILTLLAIGIGIRMAVEIKLTGYAINRAKALYLAEAGLRKAVSLLLEDNNRELDSLNEIWSTGYDAEEEEYLLKDIKLGDGAFTVSFPAGSDEDGKPVYLYGASAEDGRININKADKADDLTGLLGITEEIAECILDWKDSDSLARVNGAEDSDYEESVPPYRCKDAPFSVAEELLLVKGMTPEIFGGIKGLITVYGDSPKVNVNVVPEAVLSALAGTMFEELPAKIVSFRNGQDGISGTADDRIFDNVTLISAQAALTGAELERMEYLINEKKAFKLKSDVFRISSTGSVRDGRVKKTIEAVVSRTADGAEILYYGEE